MQQCQMCNSPITRDAETFERKQAQGAPDGRFKMLYCARILLLLWEAVRHTPASRAAAAVTRSAAEAAGDARDAQAAGAV